MDYIIIQAGGLGSRMKSYTRNKPKALVPINNLPIIFHLFRKFPDKKFLIIGDYKKEVLRNYVHAFANVKHLVVDTSNKKGTCSGIKNALQYIPDGKSFMLIWSDLILPSDFEIPQEHVNYIGISKDFKCRWSYEHKTFEEKSSLDQGVAGLFIFRDKKVILDVPVEGEFVAWLKHQKLQFLEIPLNKTKEYGIYDHIEKNSNLRCRPFNKITIHEDKIIKEGIDKQGVDLAKKEVAWYEKAQEYRIDGIPKIFQKVPLTMEKIDGKNVFLGSFSKEDKLYILSDIVGKLKKIHENGRKEPDYFSIRRAYYVKTMERLEKVRDLVPGANQKYLFINGKKCRNIYFFQKEFEEKIEQLRCNYFSFIHGDCTFSNILVDNNLKSYFIDPRGYFGDDLLYGDPIYDWVKLYYSIVGNYDQFNQKNFDLVIDENNSISLTIISSGWEEVETHFWELIGKAQSNDIKLLHAVVWLSLTTYAWEDFDSICGSFYNGLYYLEDAL